MFGNVATWPLVKERVRYQMISNVATWPLVKERYYMELWHLTVGQGKILKDTWLRVKGDIKWFNWKQDLWKLMDILDKFWGKEFVKKILQIYEVMDSDFKDVWANS